MTVSTFAKVILQPKQTSMMAEAPPCWIAGQGTPNGDLEPFASAQKGSLYTQTNATDDAPHIYQKVDEGEDNNDWVLLAIPSTALSVAHTRDDFNIDAGSGTTVDKLIMVAGEAITIIRAKAIYTIATDTAGAENATIQIGTAVGGAQIVAAEALEAAKAIGSATSLTIADGSVAAGEMVAARLTGIAATEAGEFFVQIEYTVDG